MNGLAFEDDQADTTARALLVIGDMGIRWLAIQSAKRGEVGLEDETIVKLNFADSKRAEQQRKPLGLD